MRTSRFWACPMTWARNGAPVHASDRAASATPPPAPGSLLFFGNRNNELDPRRDFDRVKIDGLRVKFEKDFERDGTSGILLVDAAQKEKGKLEGEWKVVGTDGTEYLSGAWEASRRVSLSGQWAATAGVERVRESEEMLNGIAQAVETIRDMSNAMAAAVEEQSAVSAEVDHQVHNISELAGSSLEQSTGAEDKIHELREVANDLHELLVRFKRD